MFEATTNLPQGVVRFEAVGKVETSDDEDVLMPAIAHAAEGGRSAWSSRWATASAGTLPARSVRTRASCRTRGHRRGPAVVSAVSWVAHLAAAFGPMVPGRFRSFPLAERDAAVAWIAESR